jgi:hypothetical protein
MAVELLDAARAQRPGQRIGEIVGQRRERALPTGHHEGAGDPRGIALRQPPGQAAAVARPVQHEVVAGVAVG